MNLKYYAEWDDFENNRHRLEWWIPSVVVSPEQLTVRDDCVMQYPSIDVFSKDCLIGCGLEITIVSPERFDFLSEFYKADVKGMAVKHYIRYGQVGQYLNFHGYLDTEVYQDDFGSLKNYDIRLTANNGLALLSRFSFLDGDGNVYKGMLRNLDIIKRCLSILDIDYDYIYINHVPTLSVIGPQETIYHRVYSKSENFYDELGEPMTMKEVLEGLIFANGAKLFIYNNSVYIIDTLYLPQTSIPCKRYEFDTLDYVDTVTINNDAEALDEIQGTPSLAVTSAKNKIKIEFNKYVYSSEENIGVTPENVSNVVQTLDHYKDNEFLFRETHHLNCTSIDRFTTDFFQTNFIVRTGQEGDAQESFVRIYPMPASAYRIRFKSKRFIQADVLYISLSGQIRVVDDEHFWETNEIPGSALWTASGGTTGKTFPLFIRPVLLDDEGNVIAQYTIPNKSIATQYSEISAGTGYWTDDIGTMPIELCMFPAETGKHITQYNYNTWYDLNGGVYAPSFTTTRYSRGRDNVFAIPLYNPDNNKEFAPQGGYLAFDIYFPGEHVSPKSPIDLKDISISVVDMESRKVPVYSFYAGWGLRTVTPTSYGIATIKDYKKVEDKDIINEIVGDALFSTDSSIEVTQGTDDLGLARGTYSVFVSGNYGNTNATNERFENLEKVQYITPNTSSFTYPFNTDSEVDGIIRTIIQLPDDGGILIGGDLTTYKGVSKPFSSQANVFKLNADGSVDNTFPFLQTYTGSGGVRRMKIHNGVLYVALQHELAAYSLTTWARIRSVTVATDTIFDFEIVGDYIYIVGSFRQADDGGSLTSAPGIAKYAISNFARQAFGTGNGAGVNTGGYINTIAYRNHNGSTPRLWVGGRFGTVYTDYGTGGVSRKNIALFTLDGEVVSDNSAGPIEFNKQSGNAEVFHIYIPSDFGRVLIAGDFDSMKYYHTFSTTTNVASDGVISFVPNPDYRRWTISTLSANKLVIRRIIRIAGTDNFYIIGKTSDGGTIQSIIRKVDYMLRPDNEFSIQQAFPADADIHDLIVRQDDLIMGGDFDSFMGFSFNNIVALELNGFPKGISGGLVSLQEYVLNVFFAQLKQPRYTLTGMKVKGYYSPFQLFVYELVKRNEIVCKFIPKKMAFDLVMGTTDMDLEELI